MKIEKKELEQILSALKRSIEHTDGILKEDKEAYPYCLGYMQSSAKQIIFKLERLIED